MKSTHPSKFGARRATALGFTLLEILVTVTVAGLLLAIAVPNFVSLSTRNRLTTYTNDITSAINYARSEAIRRGLPISICASNTGTSCAGTWSNGWIVFVNTDNDSPAVVDAGETVLATHDALRSDYSLASSVYAAHLTFAANGSTASTGVFAVCYKNNKVGAKAILLNRIRVRLASDSDNNGIPNDEAGADIASCTAP